MPNDVVEASHVDTRGHLVLTVMDQAPRIVVSLETGKEPGEPAAEGK